MADTRDYSKSYAGEDQSIKTKCLILDGEKFCKDELNAIKGSYPIALNPFRINNDGTGIDVDGEVFSLLSGTFWYDIPAFTGGLPAFPDDDVDSGFIRLWRLEAIQGQNGPEYVYSVGPQIDGNLGPIPPLDGGEGAGAGSVIMAYGLVFNFSGSTQPMNAGADNDMFIQQLLLGGEPITISNNPVVYFDGTQFLTNRIVFVNQLSDTYDYNEGEPVLMDFVDGFVLESGGNYRFFVSISIDEIFVTTNPVQGLATIAIFTISNTTGADITIDASDLSNLDDPDVFIGIGSLIPGDHLGNWGNQTALDDSRLALDEGNTAIINGVYSVYRNNAREAIGGGGQRNDVYLSDVTNADSNEFDNFPDAYASKAPYGYLPYTMRAKPFQGIGNRWVVDSGLEHNNQNTTFQSYLSDNNIVGTLYRVSNTNALTKFSLPKKMVNVGFELSNDNGLLWDSYGYPVELEMVDSTIENAGVGQLYDFNASAVIKMRGKSKFLGINLPFTVNTSGTLTIDAYDQAEINNELVFEPTDPKSFQINVYSNDVKLSPNLKNGINCTITHFGGIDTAILAGLQNDANYTDTVVGALWNNVLATLSIEPTSALANYDIGDRINIANLVMSGGTIDVDYAPIIAKTPVQIVVKLPGGTNRGTYTSGGDIERKTVVSIAYNGQDTVSAELGYRTVAGGGENKKVSLICRSQQGNVAILYDGTVETGAQTYFVNAKISSAPLSGNINQTQLEADNAVSVTSNSFPIGLLGTELLLVLDCDTANQIILDTFTISE